jgi:crotonobetainyl-CoA:carnitine CoA-transferase CaiB-like acyl-CoA transferase
MADKPGYDFMIQGMCGIMDLTGEPNGEPQKVGVAWIDILTGLYGTIGIQAALAERASSGLGQHVDLSLLDTGVAVLANQAMNYLVSGTVPRRLGNAHPNIVPYQVFPATDGHFIIACGNDGQFEALCTVLGLEGIAADLAYSTNPSRVLNRDALAGIIAEKTELRTKAELIAALDAAGVPCGPINNVKEALGSAQVAARNLIIAPEGVLAIRTPMQFSRSALALERASPSFGDGRWTFSSERRVEPQVASSQQPD